jgi:hypothetical protein
MAEKVAAPKPTLSVADAVAIIGGIVIGAGAIRAVRFLRNFTMM